MPFQKKKDVPEYIYSSRVDENDIPFFEQAYFDKVEFYPESFKSTPQRFEYAKRIGYRYMHLLREDVLKRRPNLKIEQLGDEKFAWRFIPLLLNRPARPLFVCAGAGTNISFELALAARFPESQMILLDPSPQAVRFVKSITLPPNIKFLEAGLADCDGIISFHKPSQPGIGSLSVLALNPSDEVLDLKVLKLATVLKEPAIQGGAIDLLKFDIEGSEYGVIDNIIEEGIRPLQLAWEFDQPVPPWTIEKTIKKLEAYGYEIIDVWALNVLAIDKAALERLC